MRPHWTLHGAPKTIVISAVLSSIIFVVWCIINYYPDLSVKEHIIQSDLHTYNYVYDRIRDDPVAAVEYLNAFEPAYIVIITISGLFGITFFSFAAVSAYVFVVSYSIASATLLLDINCKYRLCRHSLMGLLSGLSVFILMLTPFFESLNYNVMRQGISFSLIFCAIVLINRNRNVSILFAALAALVHFPSSLLIVSYFLSIIFLDKKLYNILLFIGVMSSVLYVLEVPLLASSHLMEILPNVWPKIANYVKFSDYQVGFKLSFLTLSLFGFAMVVFLYGTAGQKLRAAFSSYLICMSVYMWMSWMPFYDRIAVMSWVYIPIFIVVSICVLLSYFRELQGKGI